MQALFDKLTENMQVIYRKSIDADNALDKLQQAGQGKFNYVFAEDAGFTTRSKRFKPYVEELAADIAALSQVEEAQLQQSLPTVIKKMEVMLITLSNLQTSIK